MSGSLKTLPVVSKKRAGVLGAVHFVEERGAMAPLPADESAVVISWSAFLLWLRRSVSMD